MLPIAVVGPILDEDRKGRALIAFPFGKLHAHKIEVGLDEADCRSNARHVHVVEYEQAADLEQPLRVVQLKQYRIKLVPVIEKDEIEAAVGVEKGRKRRRRCFVHVDL